MNDQKTIKQTREAKQELRKSIAELVFEMNHPVEVVSFAGGSYVPKTVKRWVGSRPSSGTEYKGVIAALSNHLAALNIHHVKVDSADHWAGLIFYVAYNKRKYAIASIVFDSMGRMKLVVLIDKYQTINQNHRDQAQAIIDRLTEWTIQKQYIELKEEKLRRKKPRWYDYSKKK